MLGEVLGRKHSDLAGLEVFVARHATHATIVVDMRVTVDHCHDRSLADLVVDVVQRGLGGLG